MLRRDVEQQPLQASSRTSENLPVTSQQAQQCRCGVPVLRRGTRKRIRQLDDLQNPEADDLRAAAVLCDSS